MNAKVTLLDTDIDSGRLARELYHLLDQYPELKSQTQISVTGSHEDDSFDCGNGRIVDLPTEENNYSTVLKAFHGTYIEECVKRYSDYYRWRLLCVTGRKCYSIHSDSIHNLTNLRLHIPIVTNSECFMTFYETYPTEGINNVEFRHLKKTVHT